MGILIIVHSLVLVVRTPRRAVNMLEYKKSVESHG